jgi:hypothetical protein
MFPVFAFRIAAPVDAPGSQHALEQGDEVVIVGRLLESGVGAESVGRRELGF